MVRDTVSQFSPPARFGSLYRDELRRSRYVRVYLHANAINIATDPGAKHVTHIDVATLAGRKITVSAKLFVLATGGIENARLMLASNRVQEKGLGNDRRFATGFERRRAAARAPAQCAGLVRVDLPR